MSKQKIVHKKPSRHHWFLISVFGVIILLGISAFILQRSTNIEAIAGEAIRQRIVETKQLALSKEEVEVANAAQQGEETVFFECPLTLTPAAQPHWNLDPGWQFSPLKVVAAGCADNRISCYYADDGTDINRADQIITHLDIPDVQNCRYGKSDILLGSHDGCLCDIR